MITSQLFDTFAAIAQHGVWVTTEHFETVFISETAQHLVGGKDLNTENIRSVFKELNENEKNSSPAYPLSCKFLTKNGVIKHIGIVRFPINIDNNNLFLWELIDLEEKNQHWIQQEKIDSTNSSLFEDSPIPIWDEDFSLIKKRIDALKKNGVTDIRALLENDLKELRQLSELLIVNRINQAVVELNQAETKEEVLEHFRTLTTEHSNEYVLMQMEAIFNGETSCEFDAELITFKGNKRYVHFKWIVVKGCEESYKQVFLTTTDLTKRIKDENLLLQHSNREKATLLKEIHHRVKNNLQIISSLIRLQAGNEENERVKEILAVSLSRIVSIAHVHELLYRSDKLAEIDTQEYVESLVKSLIESLVDQKEIEHEINAHDLNIPLELAIPFGLLLNEILTNSLKHAFEGRNRGLINITIKQVDNETYQADISDDGVGFDDNELDSLPETLGISLIDNLAEQLGGEVERKSDKNGTSYRLRFSIVH